jgi:hypothetical protein
MPTPYRFTTSVRKRASIGQVAACYAQIIWNFVAEGTAC